MQLRPHDERIPVLELAVRLHVTVSGKHHGLLGGPGLPRPHGAQINGLCQVQRLRLRLGKELRVRALDVVVNLSEGLHGDQEVQLLVAVAQRAVVVELKQELPRRVRLGGQDLVEGEGWRQVEQFGALCSWLMSASF